ncbi:acetyl-CoA hydrolase/transferase C-terminal domain-containing protein [Mycobacterium sp. GA-2829]|uniref:acetyl-CoA hydrolase/transferase C-terminal domain-containing protein n=1 Tax=Mycobacterium sp. GA-2829 TaxID=1772283 RepID=UPI00074047B4|nr:acetyl-CoA hydrolase/transferase C-terminal domain-containing protein [Mycobacterium sp. GA-2829]KUI34250.1 acetyl-CoA hydrolase [Mycobacterium sp. GA-2829]
MLRTLPQDRPCIIALGDGVGAVNAVAGQECVGAVLSRFSATHPGVTLILGWSPVVPEGITPDAFDRIIPLMPGWGVRALLPSPVTSAIPVSLAAIPGLLGGHLRPDVLITRMALRENGYHFCTEVSWQQALVKVGVPVWAVLDESAHVGSGEQPLPLDAVTVVGRAGDEPASVPSKPPQPIHDALADRVLALIPEGARVQYGPGQLGTALLQRCSKPLAIDTGLLTDAVIDLERRGLLLGEPSAAYLFGSSHLYEWAEGRPILRGIEHTHDVTRLSRGVPFYAVNTAIEIDPWGQINVEGVGDKVVGGIGGHPDYCTAARLHPHGLSIIAVPAQFGGRSTLVAALSRPASTPAHDVEVIVTEAGHVDLRSAGWTERRKLIERLFARAA